MDLLPTLQTGQTRSLLSLHFFDDFAAHRKAFSIGFALIACGMMVVAACDFRPASPSDLLDDGLGWMTIGVLAFGAALWLSGKPSLPSLMPTSLRLHSRGIRPRLLIPGVAAMVLLMLVSAGALDLASLKTIAPLVQFLLLSAAIILIAAGLGGTIPRLHLRLVPALPLAAILLLALVVRVTGLGTDVHTLIDEGQDISGIQMLWDHPDTGLLTSPSKFMPTTFVYTYWEAGAIAMFGRTLAALRLTNALCGVLEVVALYLLARTLFDVPTALAAALLLATFPPAIQFSRTASAYVGSSFGTFALAFAARGLKDNRRFDWVLCGISLGLTQYFYEASRLLFPPLIVIWLGLMIVVARRHLRVEWRGIAIAAVAALLIGGPIYVVIAARGGSLTDRMDDAGLGADYWNNLLANGISPQERDDLIQRVGLPFEMMVHEPEQATYYGGDQPLILDIFLPLALLGVAYVFWRWRTPAILLLLWVLATGLGNMLLSDPTQYPRYVLVFPALALLMALGIRSTLALLAPRATWVWRTALPLMLVSLVGIVHVYYFFDLYLPLYTTQVREEKPYPDGNDAVFRAVTLPQPTQIVFITDPIVDPNPPKSLLNFLIDAPPYAQPVSALPSQITPDFIGSLPHDRNYAFFVQPGDTATVKILSQYFSLQRQPRTTDPTIPRDRRLVMYFAPLHKVIIGSSDD